MRVYFQCSRRALYSHSPSEHKQCHCLPCTHHEVLRVWQTNAVLGELEPVREIRVHEIGIVVEVIAPALDRATDITTLAARGIIYARLRTIGSRD
jgi:hypothetical protein